MRARALFAGMSLVLLSGCGVTAADLPLPGGGVPGESYRLNAVFSDALNLPEKAHVKLDGVDIGRVQEIVAKDYTARVGMLISKNVTLPGGTSAELRQATPLGDVFVALHRPERPGPPIREGDTIGLPDTSAAASVEDTLSALSTLVNGGGLGQLKTIVTEVNTALADRGPQTRNLLGELNTTLATLNARTGDIDRVLAATQSLTTVAEQRRGTVDAALAEFTPAMKVLAEQTGGLTDVLGKVAAAGATGDRVLGELRGDLTSKLNDLGPVLDGFAALKDSLGPTLRGMVTLGQYVEGATKGESGAGEARLAGLTGIPFLSPGESVRIPGFEDLNGALGTISDNLIDLLKTLGGNG
ncbi:MCE family protein [Amycolatopsis nigrescens]|uniref:MCE family protein n=1 Tax=Amycolatopsis nigrescens TaxID=381445 RepID=UPI0003751157|nr:MCE family protein [Amycolatopsis nigrescens]